MLRIVDLKLESIRFPFAYSMATLPDYAEIRIGDDPRRWLSLAVLALGGVLTLTAILGLTLAPRWPDALSIAALEQIAATHTVAAPGDAKAADAQSAKPAGAPPTNRRPLAYSSVDTRTLATARAHEEVLAGRRTPIEVVIEDRPAAAVVTPPTSPAIARPPAFTRERSPVVAPPVAQLAQPPRVDVARRSPPIAVPRQQVADPPPPVDERRVAPRSPAPPPTDFEPPRIAGREPQRVQPSLAESSPQRWVPYRYESPPHREGPPPVRSNPGAGRSAPVIIDRPDAAALDDRWQRRELWFRERLQAR